MRRPRTPLPCHPLTKLSRDEARTFAAYLSYRRKMGYPDGCYGIWKVFAAQNLALARAALRNAQAGKSPANRKRPAWCSDRIWRGWRAYKDRVHAGIPLEVYADPARRKAWIESRLTRTLSPREKAAELLKRKGLAP